jgi:hypothetical protein
MSLSQDTLEKLQKEYAKIMLEKAQLAQQQTAYNAAQQQAVHTYTTNNTGNLTLGGAVAPNTSAWWNQTPVAIDMPPEEKLDEGAWDVAISQLVDLWVVRYGSRWVNESELDEFYKVAAKRLRPLNKIEMHFVNSMDVYRIVE